MTDTEKITENVKRLLSEIPDNISIVAAAKTRTKEEVLAAINAGIKIIGENYVQESIPVIDALGHIAQYHFIGHLQKNKVKYVVPRYDMIETVDNLKLAVRISDYALKTGKVMPVLIEINSGREPQKAGVFPEDAVKLIEGMSGLSGIKIMGLMTMGPRFGNAEDARPYFVETRKLFDSIKSMGLENVQMKYLSMGMSNSYKIAIQEGANVVRIGTLIFGERKYENKEDK